MGFFGIGAAFQASELGKWVSYRHEREFESE